MRYCYTSCAIRYIHRIGCIHRIWPRQIDLLFRGAREHTNGFSKTVFEMRKENGREKENEKKKFISDGTMFLSLSK